jgi:hypothetical protein
VGRVEERKVERVEVDGMELHVESVEETDSTRQAHTALPPRVESWRRRSVTGAVLTGFALGLREALEPERTEAPIIVEVSGDPPDDLAVEAHVDDVNPAESVVTVRRWLLREIADEEAAALVEDDRTDGTAEGPPGGPAPGPPER